MPNSDQEILRRVYQEQMDEWREMQTQAIQRRVEASDKLVQIQADYFQAHGEVSLLQGKMDALKELAEREGVELR